MENTIVEPDLSALVAAPAAPKEMISVYKDGDRTVVRINSSSLGVIQTCLRKAQYSLFEGWHSKQGRPALIFGSAVHAALEVFYSHPATERTIPENFTEHANLIGRGYDAPEEHFLYDAVRAFVEKAKPLELLPDSDARSITSGIWMLGHYFETYLTDQYVVFRDESGPVVERGFTMLLWEDDRLRIELFGTIDLVLQNTLTGEVLPADHKTTGRMGYEFMARVKPNHQYTGYLLGAKHVLGLTGENFLVNGLEVKARPKTARGGPPKFIRQITRRAPEDFVEFHFVVRKAVSDYLWAIEHGSWPLGHVDACAAWGGCTYHDVCSAPIELRENILDAKFSRN